MTESLASTTLYPLGMSERIVRIPRSWGKFGRLPAGGGENSYLQKVWGIGWVYLKEVVRGIGSLGDKCTAENPENLKRLGDSYIAITPPLAGRGCNG